jgi:hypothetical protein
LNRSNFTGAKIMAINAVSPGSYNSPSVQPQAQTQRTTEKPKAPEHAEKPKEPARPERNEPTLNSNGQTVGTTINVKA